MNCDHCKNPAKTELHEYKSPVYPQGKATLCDDCAAYLKDAGVKLTGGKREAEPEASTERDEIPASERVDVPAETTEPEPRTRRRS